MCSTCDRPLLREANGALVAAGYGLGTQWETVGGYVSTVSNIALVVLAVVTVGVLWRRSRRRRRDRQASLERTRG